MLKKTFVVYFIFLNSQLSLIYPLRSDATSAKLPEKPLMVEI